MAELDTVIQRASQGNEPVTESVFIRGREIKCMSFPWGLYSLMFLSESCKKFIPCMFIILSLFVDFSAI